jgi:phytoene desaturase
VGGLCVAIRLATAGHEVVVFERNPVVGGKVATLTEAGYTFDLGPTLLTMPQWYDEVMRLAGTSLAEEVELIRLDPQFQYRWPDGSSVEIPDDAGAVPAALDALSPGSGAQWADFAAGAATTWGVSERTLLARPVESPWSLISRAKAPIELGRIDGKRTLAKAATTAFDDPRLRQLVNRYATYSGSSPFFAPATLAYLPYIEQTHGCWHVVGGLGRLLDALERVAMRVGVDLRTGIDVGRITVEAGAVTAVELADGGHEPAEVVIANVDAAHLYTELLPHPKEATQLDKAGRSASAFVVCAAVRGRTDGIAHHNVFFSLDGDREFRELDAGREATDATVYACVPSVSDRTMAPLGGENWTMRVTLPPAVGVDRKLMTAAVLNRLAERGVDLRDRIEFTRTMVPADFDARYRAIGGSIYGSSSNGKAGAFRRPSNIGPVPGLFLVGDSSHPGGGLPQVAASARIVADLIAERHG